MATLFLLYSKHANASQTAIGQRVGIAQPDISKIVRRKRRVEEQQVFTRIADGLDMPAEARRLLGVSVGDEVEKSQPVGSFGTLTSPITPPRRVNSEAMDAPHGTLAQYARLDNMMGPRHLMAMAVVQLDFIGRLLAVADGSTRTRVLQVGSSFAEFAGWLHQDAGNDREAARWSDRALEWATEADDTLMISYILTRKSHHAAARRDRPATLGLAEAALRHADTISPRTRALAYRQIARGHALARDADACAHAIDKARDQAAVTDDYGTAERTLTGYCTPAYIELEAADCWLILGRTGEAITIYERCLANWPGEFERDRGLHLARLANAYAAHCEPARACAVAMEAIPIVADTGSARAADELRRLPGWLGRWRKTDEVRTLTDALTTLPPVVRPGRP
ncbi:hypothetical protein [Frankia sp. CiP3]|uniref:hypothetical protein n=1 Tax=Frankia sp. CiP3 TaxID=2880971 RepID=UPI001EF5F986|nr:hypothetical protein [Frankia sp. CiP3]